MSKDATPDRPRDFAPISDAPSGRLQLVAGYFTLWGSLGILGVCAGLALSVTRGSANALTLGLIAGVGGIMTAGLLWTGRELRERNTSGWYAGLITLAAPLISAIAGKPLATWTLIVSVVGLALLVSVRRELK